MMVGEEKNKIDKQTPKFNGSLGAVLYIDELIRTTANYGHTDLDSLHSVLESWYKEIIYLAERKVNLNEAKEEVKKEVTNDFKQKLLNRIRNSKQGVTIKDLMDLEKRRNTCLSNSRTFQTLSLYQVSLAAITGKLGLRVKMVDADGKRNWMGEE